MRIKLAATAAAVMCGVCCIPFMVSAAANTGDSAAFRKELIQASTALQSIQGELEQKVHQGQLPAANLRLLEFFPESTRTRAQTLALANTFYSMDARASYALHQEVAEQLPHEPLVMLEWAMEQHRAGEYAGALAAYDEYSKANPDYAPVHGLAADCLIRLGKIREASARWQQSERASQGTVEALESMVCDIYRDPSLEQRRSRLCNRVVRGDTDAAVQLIWLDGKYERDWWNTGPNRENLAYDVTLVRKLPPNPRIKSALCAADCSMKPQATAGDIRAILNRDGYLIDAKKTLPSDGGILSLMLASAIKSDVFSPEEARQQFGDVLRANAKGSKDPNFFNVLAFLYLDTGALLEIEEQAWKATKDPRFASGYLVERLKQKSLRSDDPVLAEALKQFPEDSWVLAAEIALKESPGEELLVQAIKAEYRHFSSAGGLVAKPSARALRGYFARLGQVLGK